MKAHKIERKFLIGLYLFLNQMQLSMHRAKWPEFSHYAKRQFSFDEILLKLNAYFLSNTNFSNQTEVPKIGFLRSLFIKKNHLYDIEQDFIMTCVVQLTDYLESSDKPSYELVCKLRLNLAYAAGVIEPRISKYKDEYSRVEHYNQNEILKTKSIKELLGEGWPS